MLTLTLNTTRRTEFLDITQEVERALPRPGMEDGLVFIYVPHTTAGVTINEGADPSVAEDILGALNRLIPLQGDYRHLEGNSAAHIKAGLLGSSVLVAVEKGRLVLGTWQAIFFCEFDGPRTRKVLLKTVGA
ncbi:MAG: YjbQ family protein [Deltaproteobacteria bacterium]|nr:YjbQ family protein [Deltaproteobacteria bacterium]